MLSTGVIQAYRDFVSFIPHWEDSLNEATKMLEAGQCVPYSLSVWLGDTLNHLGFLAACCVLCVGNCGKGSRL